MNTVRGEVQVGVVGLCRNDPPGVPNEPPYPIQICFSHCGARGGVEGSKIDAGLANINFIYLSNKSKIDEVKLIYI